MPGRSWLAAVLLCAAAGPLAAQTADARLALCVACHGAAGRAANDQWPSLAGQPQLFLETQLVLIREGLRDVPSMQPVMQGLDDVEIGALARHFASQPPARPPAAADPARALRGRTLANKLLCGTCHLPDYRGQQQVPRLAGQHEPYLLLTMKQLRDRPGPGRDTIMAATLRGLSDAELVDLAHYLAAVQP